MSRYQRSALIGGYRFGIPLFTLGDIRKINALQDGSAISTVRLFIAIFGVYQTVKLFVLLTTKRITSVQLREFFSGFSELIGLETVSSAVSHDDDIDYSSWDSLYIDIARATGWTWSQIDDMTIPQLHALQDSLDTMPPVDILVAHYLGYKSRHQQSQLQDGWIGAFINTNPN